VRHGCVEVVQDPELSKNDRPLWGVRLLTGGRQLPKEKLERAIVGALQGELHYDDIAIGISAVCSSRWTQFAPGSRRMYKAQTISAKSTAPPLGVRILQVCRSAHKRSRARENTVDLYRGSR
jgi:hypothetical protein